MQCLQRWILGADMSSEFERINLSLLLTRYRRMPVKLQREPSGSLRLESNMQFVLEGVLFDTESHKLPALFAYAVRTFVTDSHGQMSAFQIVKHRCKETAYLQRPARSAVLVTTERPAWPVSE